MDPPQFFLATLWNFICFLPYFIGLLLLGTIKGIIFCPPVCLIMTIGNSLIILGLLPYHCYCTYDSIVRAKLLGAFLKLVICVFLPAVLILWVVVGMVGSVLGGILYGFLSPIFATFNAVGERKANVFSPCFYDGTWSTIKGTFTVVRNFNDASFHSYNSFLEDLQQKELPNGQYYEIRNPRFGSGFVTFLLPCPYMMNTTTTTLTCQKDLACPEQIKAENLFKEEKDYLGKLVLHCGGGPERLKDSNIGSPPESECKQTELDALALRLQGITKSVSRYPTFGHHFEKFVNTLSEDLVRGINYQFSYRRAPLLGYLATN